MVKRFFLPFQFFFYLVKYRTQLIGVFSITIRQAGLNSGHSVEEDEYRYLQAMKFSNKLVKISKIQQMH